MAPLSMQGCQNIGSVCSWLSPVRPDAEFETRWTLAEKRQVLALDEKIDEFCP